MHRDSPCPPGPSWKTSRSTRPRPVGGRGECQQSGRGPIKGMPCLLQAQLRGEACIWVYPAAAAVAAGAGASCCSPVTQLFHVLSCRSDLCLSHEAALASLTAKYFAGVDAAAGGCVSLWLGQHSEPLTAECWHEASPGCQQAAVQAAFMCVTLVWRCQQHRVCPCQHSRLLPAGTTLSECRAWCCW